ncbi:hypothetical protein Tco_1038794 [Tanacetum coccineum]
MAKTLKTNKDKDLKILEQKTMTKAQDQISQSMKEQAYKKIKTKTKTQELNDKAISIIVDVFKSFSSLGWWTIPLDKGLFKEVPSVDSSWSESSHPSAAPVRVNGNTRSSTASCDAPRMPGAWFSRDNAKYCFMVRVLMSTPAIVPSKFRS